ncbi:MAG: hypothetical protein Q9208_008159 [Pyrenodesmia sp. 3 TL-2023]
MSGYPSNQSNPSSTTPGNNLFSGVDAFNTLMNPAIPEVTQPMFGQSWAGATAWNSMPLVNFDIGSSFQSGFTPSRGLDLNQQNDAQIHSEDDDYFYDNEDYQPINTSQLTVDSNERSKTPMSSELNVSPLPRRGLTSQQASASAKPSQSQLNDISMSQSKSANATPSSTQVSKERQERMDELRAKLLASKRARSTTPLPPTPRQSIGATVASGLNEPVKASTVESAASYSKSGQTDVETPAIEKSTAQADVKSLKCPPTVPTLPLANADIQGLINEYRAPSRATTPRAASGGSSYPSSKNPPSIPRLKGVEKAAEAVKGLEVPSLASTKEFPPLPSSKVEKIGVSGNSGGPSAAPQSIKRNGPTNPQSRSPGSSESGEIRSDREPGSATVRHDHGPTITTANKKPGNASQTTVAAPAPNQRPQSKRQTTQTDLPKPKKISSTPKRDFGPHAQDRLESNQAPSQSRSDPLAQRIHQPQKLAVQSHPQETTPRTDRQRDAAQDRTDSQLPRKPSLPSAPASAGRPDSSSIFDNELARQESRYGRGANEDCASESKKPATRQHQVSSESQGTSAGSEASFRIRGTAHDALTTSSPTGPVVSAAELSQPRTQSEVANAVPDRPDEILSLPLQKQIQNLGIDVTPEGLRDLYDFLDYHRFFNKEYRAGFLARHRRLRALEEQRRALDEEKLALERESLVQYELVNSVRAQSLAASERSEPPILAALQGKRGADETPSKKPMPPPLSIPRKSNVGGAVSINGRNDSNEATPIRSTVPQKNEQLTPGGSSLKRRHADDAVDLDRGRKFTRVSDVQARMQSLPSSDIPAPEWQKQLLWASTDPFRIRWITIAPTRFHSVGHLKNAFNDGQAVLIGRDGQEIEPECGRALCELIDEAAREHETHDRGY